MLLKYQKLVLLNNYKLLNKMYNHLRLEIDQIKSATHIKVIFLSFIIFHTRFAIFISILSYVLLGNYVTTQKVRTKRTTRAQDSVQSV